MTAAECLERLLACGWTHEAVFRCPAGVLSDWFREQNEESVADKLAEPVGLLICKLRDECYLRAPWEQHDGIRRYIRQTVGDFAELEAKANRSEWITQYQQEPPRGVT